MEQQISTNSKRTIKCYITSQFTAKVIIGILMIMPYSPIFAQQSGEEIFNSTCKACHTIGGGKLVGPDLENVQDRHNEAWLISFIKSSTSLVKSGDKAADSIFQAFNQVVMPDHPTLSDADIKGIIAYIKENSAAPIAANEESASATTEAENTEETLIGNAKRGRLLFVGELRFDNGGASCNSCHNVDLPGYISGGALGKDLTHAVSRLSEAGVAAVVSGLPFPQMKETYTAHPVSPQEIADLTAFLNYVDQNAPENISNAMGNYVITGGVFGASILLGLYSFFWVRRKKGAVYSSVFNRQTRSE